MPKRIEYPTGTIINNLTILEEVEPHVCPGGWKLRKFKFMCHCENKTEFIAIMKHIKSGLTTSCGCVNSKQAKERFITHGLSKHPLHGVWSEIKNRTLNEKHKYYLGYGGRGITICDEWKDDFQVFYDWSMSNGYSKGLSIDRTNNDGSYEPDNCRWVTMNVQARNTRKLMITNTSGFRGVYKNKRNNKWFSLITVNNRRIYLGSFDTKYDAGRAYDRYIIENGLEHTKNFDDY